MFPTEVIKKSGKTDSRSLHFPPFMVHWVASEGVLGIDTKTIPGSALCKFD